MSNTVPLSEHPIHWEQDVLMEAQRRAPKCGITPEQAKAINHEARLAIWQQRNPPKFKLGERVKLRAIGRRDTEITGLIVTEIEFMEVTLMPPPNHRFTHWWRVKAEHPIHPTWAEGAERAFEKEIT